MDELVAADLQPVKSCLLQRSSGGGVGQFSSVSTAMKRAILEVVASGAATSPQIVEKYASCTMLAASMKAEGVTTEDDTIPSCVSFLEQNGEKLHTTLIHLNYCTVGNMLLFQSSFGYKRTRERRGTLRRSWDLHVFRPRCRPTKGCTSPRNFRERERHSYLKTNFTLCIRSEPIAPEFLI